MLQSAAITNTCFVFRVSTSSVPFKNIPENKNILLEGGEGLERGSRGSSCLSVRQVHWLHTWMALGETLPRCHCKWLPLTTGYTRRVLLEDHVMQGAEYPLVVQDCAPNDLSHIPQGRALWSPDSGVTCTLNKHSLLKHSHSRYHPLLWFTAGTFELLVNTASESRRRGTWGLVFLKKHQEEISVWPNCVRFGFNYETSPSSKNQNTPTSLIILWENRPLAPVGTLLLAQRQTV